MSRIILKIWVFIVVLCASLSTSAYDFEEDGLYYNILSEEDRTVEVTYKYNYNDVSGDIEIPRKVIHYSKTYTVTSIGEKAFYNCKSLTSVIIPNSVTSIGYYAFDSCSGLTSVTIPNSVTSIGYRAFINCKSLTSVTIPNSVTSIGYGAFDSCSGLTSVIIPNSVTTIRNEAFNYCSGLTSVTIPNSVILIGDWAFGHCSGLTSVTIPNSVISIGNTAFVGCSSLDNINVELGNNKYSSIDGILYNKDQTSLLCCPGAKISVTIPNSVTSIGHDAFSGCSGLTSVIIPNSVTTIRNEAFSGCSGLTSVTIGNSVTSIGDRAFSSCRGLTSVTIPNSVTSIGEWAFSYCDEIKDIYMQCEVPIECKPGFSDNILKTTVLHIPMGTLTEYEKVDPWCNFWNIEELPEVKAEEIILSNDTLKLFVNETSKLEVEIFPSNTSVKHIEWYSDDPSVATVDQDGIVKGLSAGTTLIFATCGEAKASCIVNVEPTSGINGVAGEHSSLSVAVTEGRIHILNKDSKDVVRVFSTQGLLLIETIDSEIYNLATGLYVVTIGNKSFKVKI